MNKIYNILGVKNYTKYFKKQEVNKYISYAIVSYIGPLFLIPIILKKHKQSKYMLFHINQGFNLFILELIFAIMVNYYNSIFNNIISFIIYLIIVSLFLISILNTINYKSIKMPLIGNYSFIKSDL